LLYFVAACEVLSACPGHWRLRVVKTAFLAVKNFYVTGFLADAASDCPRQLRQQHLTPSVESPFYRQLRTKLL
jgi:hypothetical protein